MNASSSPRRLDGLSLAQCLLMLAMLAFPAARAHAQWAQWGGPRQDFTVDVKGLASDWPESGPRKVWSRALGEGYSGIVVNDGVLYTMYRVGAEDVVCALAADTGKTVWEYKYASPPAEGHEMAFTAGPRSTPLYSAGRLYTVGVSGIMHCLDAKTGKPHWKHNLWKDYNGSVLNHGYSSSPISYKNLVIVLVGGDGNAVIAFDAKDGAVKWKRQSFTNSYSTPKLINVDGEDQLACFMANELIGLDPTDGDLKWSYEIGNQWGQNICMPTLNEDNILFFSTQGGGSRGVKLTRDGDKTKLEEVWSKRKIQFYHVNSIRIGDYVYGSSGSRSPCFFSAINVKDGKVAWRKRGFGKATCLYADGKFIILDEEGNLGLATATPEDFTVHAKVPVLEKVSWTIPTLVGKTLYLRDKNTIQALDLG